jgi:hypothetical protein
MEGLITARTTLQQAPLRRRLLAALAAAGTPAAVSWLPGYRPVEARLSSHRPLPYATAKIATVELGPAMEMNVADIGSLVIDLAIVTAAPAAGAGVDPAAAITAGTVAAQANSPAMGRPSLVGVCAVLESVAAADLTGYYVGTPDYQWGHPQCRKGDGVICTARSPSSSTKPGCPGLARRGTRQPYHDAWGQCASSCRTGPHQRPDAQRPALRSRGRAARQARSAVSSPLRTAARTTSSSSAAAPRCTLSWGTPCRRDWPSRWFGRSTQTERAAAWAGCDHRSVAARRWRWARGVVGA